VTKVFCFFFSKKKSFYLIASLRRRLYVYTVRCGGAGSGAGAEGVTDYGAGKEHCHGEQNEGPGQIEHGVFPTWVPLLVSG
jgi:hypothetical protein